MASNQNRELSFGYFFENRVLLQKKLDDKSGCHGKQSRK